LAAINRLAGAAGGSPLVLETALRASASTSALLMQRLPDMNDTYGDPLSKKAGKQRERLIPGDGSRDDRMSASMKDGLGLLSSHPQMDARETPPARSPPFLEPSPDIAVPLKGTQQPAIDVRMKSKSFLCWIADTTKVQPLRHKNTRIECRVRPFLSEDCKGLGTLSSPASFYNVDAT